MFHQVSIQKRQKKITIHSHIQFYSKHLFNLNPIFPQTFFLKMTSSTKKQNVGISQTWSAKQETNMPMRINTTDVPELSVTIQDTASY